MDYVDGTSLAKRSARDGGAMPLMRVKEMASDIAKALAHAHSNGVVHGSLGPTDILIADRYLVSDFGMPNMGFSSPEATAARALFGDARYVSPEQCLGEAATPKSDQYALGAILYEALAGKPPFVGKSAFLIMKQHCEEAPIPVEQLRPECPPDMAATVMRLLSKEPEDRYIATSMLVHVIDAWPLAPSTSRRSLSPSPAQSAKNALDSFDRCLAREDFLGTFYQCLLKDERLGPFLKDIMNFDLLASKLERSIRHLLESAEGQTDAIRELEIVAEKHRRMGLDESNLRRFVDILVGLVAEFDTVDPSRRDRLRSDWREATRPGLRRFAEIATGEPVRNHG